MTLDEAINHCKEVADSNMKQVENADWKKGSLTERACIECANDHLQLADWLKELKAYKEQDSDAISRQATIDAIRNYFHDKYYQRTSIQDCRDCLIEDVIKSLPSVTSQQRTGRWIPVGYDGYADGNPVYDWWECSECGWEHTGDEETLTTFCPDCGARMKEEE